MEKTVCANPELSKLDEEMAKAYKDALASLSPEGQKETKEYQRKWLKEISYIKAKEDKFYSENKEYPSSYHDESITRELKSEYKDRIKQLQNSLTKFPGHTFRNVYVNHSEVDKSCMYLIVERRLSYPQIESPRDKNEKSWNAVILKKVDSDLKKEDSDLKEDSDDHDCTNTRDTYWVSFSNKHLISFQGNHYYYVHGHAHGYGSHRISYTWLWEEKRELKASDLFDDKTGWRKKIRALVAQKKKEWENSSSGTSLVEPGSDVLFSPDQWSIEKEGMGVWLYMNNFAEATLIDIDWKPLNPYLSKKGRSLIFE